MDTWRGRRRRDDEHQDDWPRWHFEETEESAARFLFATEGSRLRGRIPLSPAPVLTIDAEPPPRTADGSVVMPAYPIAPVAVEVRLRPAPPPSSDQVDAVRAWLRTHRAPRASRPAEVAPEPLPPLQMQPLEPVIALEPARRGSLWPLAALSIGLAVALFAAVLL